MQEKEAAYNHYKQLIENSIEMPAQCKGDATDLQLDIDGEREDDSHLEESVIEANMNFIEK